MLKPGRSMRWALAALLALAAGIAAFFVSRELLTPDVAAPPPVRPAAIPEHRPDIALADREGRLRRLSEWDGQPLILNFWATWCAPCRREIPMLNELARDPAYAEFALIGIAIDFREDVLRFLQEVPVGYEVLIGEQDGFEAAAAFGVESVVLPFTAFTDRKGRIATLHFGELHRPQAEVILAAIAAVDAGQINMETARERIRRDTPRID